MIYKDKLNENQIKAVEHIEGPCMVLAGPGSGKTRVITYRIANMIMKTNIPPARILAISFTKNSSIEMKNRALSICKDERINKVTFGTFHAVFYKILRYFTKYKIESILDEKTKRMVIKDILKKLQVENGEDDETVGQVINEISYVKNELMDKQDFESELLTKDEFINLYNMYETYKDEIQKIDFDDMLLRTYYLLNENKNALEFVRQVYKYILVDEFQDINKVQFEVLKLIANPNNNIFIVGDEDQSIYGFRGARPDFLLKFEDYFEKTQKIVLDINYRSKKEIIDASNKLIQNNLSRHDKIIKCYQGSGSLVNYIEPKDSEDEAIQIGKQILQEIKKDYVEYSDFAVIYRTNIQSRALVDVFMDMRIPFTVKDSIVTIYDHWACRDILSYLKISIKKYTNEDWIRIINKPFRYISRENLNQVKDDNDFIGGLITKCNLHPRQVKTINDLEIDVHYIKQHCTQDAISYIRTTLEYDKYILDYCTNRKIKTNGLIEILNELESSASNFEKIEDYLAHIDKVKEELKENQNKTEMDGVVFTTMHSAKGLEFKNVYIIGINEGTIPHEKSYEIDNDEKKLEQIEEERRLLYVGITRAEDNLTLSYPKSRYGKKVYKSRFLDDINRPTKKEIKSIKIGDRINHKSFGDGIVTGKEGNMLEVKFKNVKKNIDYQFCKMKNILKNI